MKKGFIHLIGMSDEGASMITYDLIGNTPLVLLEHYSDDKVKIYAKLEQWNPGGSVIEIIKMLQAHPAVQQVFHPSIESHLNHDVHMAQADGHTGVIAFEVKNTESAKQLIKATSYYTLAESLGAVESLISVPALMTHASIPADIRAKEGITDGLVRISVGIEDTEDLVDDLKQALDTL